MAFVDPNPSDILDAYLRACVEKMSPAQLEELGELMSRLIVDPPFHGEPVSWEDLEGLEES